MSILPVSGTLLTSFVIVAVTVIVTVAILVQARQGRTERRNVRAKTNKQHQTRYQSGPPEMKFERLICFISRLV